jgi:hypothetical protein
VPGGRSITITSSSGQAHHHRAAPDHRLLLRHQEPDRHGVQAERLDRLHQLAGHFRFAVHAEHPRQAGAMDVCVDQAGAQAHLREAGRQVHRDRAFAHAALAAGDCDHAADGGEEFRTRRVRARGFRRRGRAVRG